MGVFRQTQSHRVVSNLWRLDTQRALGSATQTHLAESNTKPQPHCWTAGHLHEQVVESKVCGAGQDWKGEQPQVALTAEVPQRHCCWAMQTQSQRALSNLCRLELQRALGSVTHWHWVVSQTRPQPHEVVAAHLHWQATVSKAWPCGQDG